MPTKVYLKKSTNPNKKYMVFIEGKTGGKTVHFGARKMSDYTKHKDEDRKRNYIARHKKRENWNKSGIKTAGFWSRWLLWNKTTITASKRSISNRFGVKFVSGWPKKRSGSRGSKARFGMRSKSKKKSKSKRRDHLSDKFERCVKKIKRKSPKRCFKGKKWKGGEGCYNPWAICTASLNRKRSR